MIRAPRWYPYVLLMPAAAIMLLVVFLPLLYNVWLSFRNMSLAHFMDHRFVGLEQYRRVLGDPILYVMLGKSIAWTAVVGSRKGESASDRSAMSTSMRNP